MAAERFEGVPVQRCLWHLARGVYRAARYSDRASEALAAAAHLRAATDEVFTFLTHPAAGRLMFGDKGRPELGTGVLERVMREMNRRTMSVCAGASRACGPSSW